MMKKSPSIHDSDVIRGRTTIFYINDIFEKNSNNSYTKSALLYQDILKFNFTESGHFVKEFTFNDLAKWLIKRNLDFATYYSDSRAHVSLSNRIANRRDYIQKCIHNFVNSRLLRIVGTRKAEKNDSLIDVYRFTWAGLCLSLLVHYYKADVPPMKISLSVLEAIATYLTIQHSRINRFAANLYTQSARIEECSRAIIELLWRMLHDVHAAVRNQFLSEFLHGIIYLLLTHKETSPSFFEKVFKRALVELDEGTRALILQDMKLKVESKILQRGAPEHYERIWLDNIHNYANVVLYVPELSVPSIGSDRFDTAISLSISHYCKSDF